MRKQKPPYWWNVLKFWQNWQLARHISNNHGFNMNSKVNYGLQTPPHTTPVSSHDRWRHRMYTFGPGRHVCATFDIRPTHYFHFYYYVCHNLWVEELALLFVRYHTDLKKQKSACTIYSCTWATVYKVVVTIILNFIRKSSIICSHWMVGHMFGDIKGQEDWSNVRTWHMPSTIPFLPVPHLGCPGAFIAFM